MSEHLKSLIFVLWQWCGFVSMHVADLNLARVKLEALV